MCKNPPCSQNQRAQPPDTSFEYSKFIANGFLKVPVNMLSNELLINIVDMLLVHIEKAKDPHMGLDEAQSCGEIPTKSSSKVVKAQSSGEIPTKSCCNVIGAQSCGEIPKKSHVYKENRIRMCSFCRKRHELGFSYCPAYGNRCEFCGKYNHDQRACWLKYPNFCRFRKGKIDRKSFSTERSSDNYTKILTQENVQVENIVQHLAKEGSESSSSKCEDLEDLKRKSRFQRAKISRIL